MGDHVLVIWFAVAISTTYYIPQGYWGVFISKLCLSVLVACFVGQFMLQCALCASQVLPISIVSWVVKEILYAYPEIVVVSSALVAWLVMALIYLCTKENTSR